MSTFLSFAPRFRRTTLIVALLGIPLLFLPGATNAPFSVPKLSLLLGATLLVLSVRAVEVAAGRAMALPRRFLVPTVALLLPLTLSWIASPYRGWATLGAYGRFQGLLPYLALAVFGVLLADAFRGRPMPIVWTLATSGAVVGAYSLTQMLGLDPVPHLVDGVEMITNTSTIGHTNFTGGFMAITLPFAIYLWLRADRLRLMGAVLTIFTGAGVLTAFSQGGWAAALVGTLVLGGSLLADRQPAAKIVCLGAASLVAIIVVGSVALSLALPTNDTLGGTIRTRGYLWASAFGMAAESPLVGRGPNSYAIEGVRHRSLPSALSEEYATADDPHSVPLSFLANAGGLGLIGWSVMMGWALRQAARPPVSSPRGAFLAALCAYGVQSLVSIDDLPLRLALWACVAGVVAGTQEKQTIDRDLQHPMDRTRVLIAVSLSLVVLVSGGYWVGRFLFSDIQIEQGVDAFEEGNVNIGRARFTQALSFRDEPEYRKLFSAQLATAALDRGVSGISLIEEMREVDRYLGPLPEPNGLRSSATLLHYWGEFQPSAYKEALALFRRALRYDPYNPLLRAQVSEVLIDLGRRNEAVDFLEGTLHWYRGTAPEYWGALAVARLMEGDEPGAKTALNEGTVLEPHNCRVVMARELIYVASLPRTAEPLPQSRLSMTFACGRGLYEVFLDRLPSSRRHFFED